MNPESAVVKADGGFICLATKLQVLVYSPHDDQAGFQIDKVQHGEEPDDWKPMTTIGAGVREIRIRDAAGAFRVVYLAKLADAVYVLHAFQKKTQTTTQQDIALARKRFKDLMKEHGS